MTRQFDVFARLVASGSIAECSDSLGLPPVEVIAAMDRLEQLLGHQIFAVEEGRVALTEQGRKIVSALGEMALEDHVLWSGSLTGAAGASLKQPEPTREPAPESAREAETVDFEPVRDEHVVTPKHFRPLHSSAPPSESPLPASPPTADAAHQPAGNAVRIITLASHPAIFSHFQEALLAFEDASPDIGIELTLESIDEDEAARLFLEGKADIAYYYALAEGHHFPSRYAWSERISLFVRADHPLANEEALGAREIGALPYLALGPGSLARNLTEEALAASGLLMPAPALETDDLYEIMNTLKRSDACFAAFGPMARDFGRMSGMARLAYASGLPQIQVRQAIRPALAEDPAIMALAEFLFR